MLTPLTGVKVVVMEIIKHFELNENENRIFQNLWNAANAVATGKYTTLNVRNIILEKRKTSNPP